MIGVRKCDREAHDNQPVDSSNASLHAKVANVGESPMMRLLTMFKRSGRFHLRK